MLLVGMVLMAASLVSPGASSGGACPPRARAELTLVLYNPASRTRREQLTDALVLLREHRAPDTRVVVARAVGSDIEAVTVTTLGVIARLA